MKLKIILLLLHPELPTETLFIKVKADGVTREIPVSPNQSILDATLKAGLISGHRCKIGNCGTCRAMLTKGKVHHSRIKGVTHLKFQPAMPTTLDSNVIVDFNDRQSKPNMNRDNLIKIGFVISAILLFVFTLPCQ